MQPHAGGQHREVDAAAVVDAAAAAVARASLRHSAGASEVPAEPAPPPAGESSMMRYRSRGLCSCLAAAAQPSRVRDLPPRMAWTLLVTCWDSLVCFGGTWRN